jgi:carboxyl-terminal processing protease
MTNRIRLILISVSSVLVFYVLIGGVLGKSDSTSEKTYRNLGVYTEVLSRIKSDYVTQPDLSKVTRGAIRGLLEALDPYSTYFTPEEYKEYLAHPEPGPGRVGIYLSKKMGFATIISVLPDSPAEKAGVKPGDLLDRIDGQPTRELSAVQLERELAGQPGSKLTISVVREARGEPQTISMIRELPQYPPVVSKMMEDNAAYLRVATFNQGTHQQVADKLKELAAAGATKVVLDLRDCAGGEVQEAVDTASLFLDKGLVTYAVGQRFPRENFDVKPVAKVYNLPLAVLINQSTAGPAEIVAAAVLGHKRGQVVGTRSFGVGVVQKNIPVGDGSGLLLSVAKYYRLDGKAISDNGVAPSVVQTANSNLAGVENEQDLEEPTHFGGKDDVQLQKALEILKQESAAPKAA